ncbi:MAG: LacI family DNA-binding transcriptional regulator [Bryocella sp.]
MKDIATDLGISVVTVSKVLNNHHDISAATKERVLRRVKELNYRPSLRAQGLVSGKTFMIGVVVPDLVHAFFSEIAVSIATCVKSQGYNLLITSANEVAETEVEEVDLMLRHGVDALIIASCQPNPDFLLRVKEYDIPVLLMDRHFSKTKTGFIGADDKLIGRMATQHLIDIGRRRIAHIGGGNVSTSLERLEGYREVLRKNKIRVLPEYVVKRIHVDESSDVTARAAMESLLDLKHRPDAVFCHNDPAAIGAMNAILDRGLRIPEDIAVIGCGNIRYSESLCVPLSTIDVPAHLIGEHAAEMILRQISEGKEPKSILIPPRLIQRQSTTVG